MALVACAAAVALRAGLASLSDPDLPHHLAMGEWIAMHGRVPFVEPFAWTRAGAPYFAYSWLAEIVMFVLLRAGGAASLHVLAALAGAGVVFASAGAARSMGARPSGITGFAAASGIIALESTPLLRPQLFMHLLVPIAWMCVARSRRDDYRSTWPLLVLFVASAIAANIHITFLLMAAPIALIVVGPRRGSGGEWRPVAATVLGWLASPYALRWWDVVRLNFEPNSLTTLQSITGELGPGFVVSPVTGAALALLPLAAWAGRPRRPVAWADTVYALLWLAGLLLYAKMFKGLGPWWWCATPLALMSLDRLPTASGSTIRAVFASLLVALLAALALPSARFRTDLAQYEGSTTRRTLPSIAGFAAEPAAAWLERNLRPEARGRALTAFNYGSYLEWRLPRLSESIDGRTIFPDSAALPDTPRGRRAGAAGPWRSADLAIVPVTYPSARLLDVDSAWMRVGVAMPAPWAPHGPRVGLWVRRRWLAAEGRGSAAAPSDGVLR